MELSELQKSIIESPSNRSVVIASAASGKTCILTEKVRQLLRAGIDPKQIAVITFTNMAASELRQRLGADYKDGLFVGTIHALANYMLCSGGVSTRKVLDNEDFDKLFDMIKQHPTCVQHLEWILLDEAQDSDDMQFNFIFEMIKPDYFFVVGDEKQCQPAGTKILMRGGKEKNIEEIEIGDEVVWYDNENGRCCSLKGTAYNSIHKYVTNISKRICNQEIMVTIQTEDGLISKYTQNHRTFIKMREDSEYEHAVYLMCDDNYRFRIGKITVRGTKAKNGNPWRTKMLDEGCQRIWLLRVFKTDLEARVYEQKMSYFYQIPQICWQTDKVKWTQEQIDYIYDGIDTCENARKCLKAHQLDIDFPLVDRRIEWSMNQKFASNSSSQLYAINIIPEIMDCLVYNPISKNNSNKAFKHITGYKEWIEKPISVYSLEVEGGTYIADGIITHNSIYQWKNSNPKLMKQLVKKYGAQLFDMNENYRNGNTILSFAKRLIRPTGLEDNSIAMRPVYGNVIETPFSISMITNTITKDGKYGDWAILTRTNAEISQISYALERAGIPFDTFKQGDLSKEELLEIMAQDTVKVLTVHSAKGLEWSKVIVLGMKYYNSEERNVCYVAATRARELLIWMTSAAKKTNYKKRF